MTKAQFPEKLKFLFVPARYKVAYGGRGGAKSWGFARALLILAARKPLRILCTREVQKSIKDSVHKLLSDQIQNLGLGKFYEVLEATIRGINGTEFVFAGLATNTVESIKSFEGCDIVWAEEAQFIKKRSWDILIPTIRRDGSEIWVSLNPDLETDETYMRFILNAPPGAQVVPISYRDNPWFSSVMEDERLHCQKVDPEGYLNIWEGQCRPAVDGAIYYKEVQSAENENRVRNIPYDPLLRVHLVMDLGWNDSLSIAFVQKSLSEIRIIKYLEYTQTSLDVISNEIKALGYNWGKVWLPHDGFAKPLNSGGKTTAGIRQALGRDGADKGEVTVMTVEDGIRNAPLKFSQFYFDAECTAAPHSPTAPPGQTLLTHRLMECLKRYRRRVSRENGVSTTPVHDDYSHGADCFRYIAINADSMINENYNWTGEDYRSAGIYDEYDSVTGE